MFAKKNIKKCKVLGKFKIDIDVVLNQDNSPLKFIGETDKYNIYSYKPSTTRYFLRQDKNNPKKVVSLDWYNEHYDVFCIYDNILIAGCKGPAEAGMWDAFLFIDPEDGSREKVKLRSKYSNFDLSFGGYGRFYNQDTIKKMYVKDNKLLIEFNRVKYTGKEEVDSPYKKDMDYILTFGKNENGYYVERSYE